MVKIKLKCEKIEEQIPDWEINAKKSFGYELEKILEEYGLKIKGDYSHLSVLLYTLEVDLDNLKVNIWFGNKQEKVAVTNLNPELVTKKILSEYEKMKSYEINEEDFISKLYKAYSIAALKNNIKVGNKVRLSYVLQEYVLLLQGRKFLTNPTKSNFRGYGRVQFSYDLYRLKLRL